MKKEEKLPSYDGEILTKRPDKMKYKEYRELVKSQSKKLKARVREGFLFYKSWEWEKIGTNGRVTDMILHKYPPFESSKKGK